MEAATIARPTLVAMDELCWGLSLSLAGDLAQPDLIGELAESAEDNGWDGFFVWDHLWNRTGEPFADPWISLATAAMATERVRIGTLVTPLPRRRPQVLAQQAATLDRLSGGRFTLGLGLGHDNYGEYSVFGEPLTDARSRADKLDSGIDFLVDALTGGEVPLAGGRKTTIASAQPPRCPIWVAASLTTTAGPRRAARHGLEGIAVAGITEWQPHHVEAVLAGGGLEPGSVDVVLTGGTFPDPIALAGAGSTWVAFELPPGTTAQEARALAGNPPRT